MCWTKYNLWELFRSAFRVCQDGTHPKSDIGCKIIEFTNRYIITIAIRYYTLLKFSLIELRQIMHIFLGQTRDCKTAVIFKLNVTDY